jgi:hypothetical protein
MKLLFFLTEAFIATFGITRPDARHERTVALLLGGFLLAAAVGIALLSGFLLWQIHSGGR